VASVILNFRNYAFLQCNICVFNRSTNVSTKFGEDWSNSKEMQPCLEIQDGGSNVKAIYCKKSAKSRLWPLCQTLAVFYTGDYIIVNVKAPKGKCINRNMTFEPLSVQFEPKLRPVGSPRKREKRKKVGEESHKTVIFHHHVEAPFCNRSAHNLVSL